MKIKRVIILGTMIVTMSFAGTAWGKSAISPIPVPKWSIVDLDSREDNTEDELLTALNLTSEDDLIQKLYNGHSLRAIAEEQHGDYNTVIALQIQQLKAQLDERLARGSISAEQHAVQSAEVEHLITESANAEYNPA